MRIHVPIIPEGDLYFEVADLKLIGLEIFGFNND